MVQSFTLLSAALQALIDGRVLCVHGGLSPDLRTLDQVRPSKDMHHSFIHFHMNLCTRVIEPERDMLLLCEDEM